MNTAIDQSPILLDRYIQDRHRKGYAQSTLRLYRYYHAEFLRYLETHEELDDFKEIDRHMISRFQEHLHGKRNGLSISTQRLIVIMLSQFFGWIQREGILFHNPTAGICLPRENEIENKGR